MITNQIMQRTFMESKISQRTKDSYFNATELLAVYNNNSETQKVFAEYWSNKSTKEFINELEKDIFLNIGNSPHLESHTKLENNPIVLPKCYETKRGKGGATWMHPYLLVDFAMWLSPQYKLQMIKWVYDNLIDFRNQAGDYYKEMCDSICKKYELFYKEKPNYLVYIKEANFMNSLVYNQYKGGMRNELSENELNLLNQLQKINIKLIDSGEYKTNDRHLKLKEFASSYKLANF
jgi:hypothetical protein